MARIFCALVFTSNFFPVAFSYRSLNIRFRNAKTGETWEKQFSATTQYDASQQLAAVQETLVNEMVKDLTDQIFNATVADW